MELRSVVSIALVAISTLSGDAISDTGVGEDRADDAIVAKLKVLRPDLAIEGTTAVPIPGLIAIELTGGNVLYASKDGRYLIAGELYEVGDTLVNLAEKSRDEKRKQLVAGVSLDDMVVFPAQGDRKAVISVFTDVDCGYCRKLHLEVPQLNQMGVEVRYLAFPRTGVGSPGYDKLVTTWCSADRRDAITRMKLGEELSPKTCDNAVAQEYELGQLTGVTGTPAIVLEDGRLLPGYVTADQLAETLGI